MRTQFTASKAALLPGINTVLKRIELCQRLGSEHDRVLGAYFLSAYIRRPCAKRRQLMVEKKRHFNTFTKADVDFNFGMPFCK